MRNSRIAQLFMLLILTGTVFAQNRTDSVHVASYTINLSITDFVGKVIDGDATLRIVSKVDGLSVLRLDLKQLTVDSVTSGSGSLQFEHTGDKLTVAIPVMNAGDSSSVTVFYRGMPGHDDNFGGFYYSGGYAYNVGVALHDQPHNYGRCWFPCVEEFTDKSSYSFNIRTEQGKTAVCNGVLTATSDLGDGTTLWSWHLDEPIPTYLASVAVGDYLCYSDTIEGIEKLVPVSIYAPPAVYPNIEASFANLKSIFGMFEQNFGPYSWPRIGYVCTSMTGGAMEHATNIAYPNMFVNGALTYESVYAHELFHHWFGNLITCENPEEMWINEGFASFSEPLTAGHLYSTPGNDAYIQHIRSTHTNVLKNIAKDDGGLYALDAVPQEHTYGTHSYSKGALVIHTLKTYMGDSLFFSSIRQLLADYSFKNVNSEEFFEALSEISGTDLSDFYNDWVHQPGFPDFEVADITGHGCGIFGVQVRQSGYGTAHTCRNVPIDITFVSQDRTMYTLERQMLLDSVTDIMVTLPFTPVFAILNRGDGLSDAVIDGERTIGVPGFYQFEDALCNLNVSGLADTAFFRVEHHYSAPVYESLPQGIHRISGTHYWTVRFAGGVPEGKVSFKLQRGNPNQPDYELFQSGHTFDNLKLLYRENEKEQWTPVAFTRTGTPYNATVTAHDINPGQYCFSMGDEDASVGDFRSGRVRIYPNPAGDMITVDPGMAEFDKALIYDSLGKCVKSVKSGKKPLEINISSLKSGNYVIVLAKGRGTVGRGVFVKEKI